MSKPKADGLKAGYDPQLKTPSHDKLCLEYANKSNSHNIFYQIKDHAKIRINAMRNLTNGLNSYLNKKETKYYFEGETIEIPNEEKKRNDYLLKGKIIKKEITLELIEQTDNLDCINNWEYPIKSRDFLIGVIDFKTDFILKRLAKIKFIENKYFSQTIEIQRDYYQGCSLDFNEHNFRSELDLAKKQNYVLESTNETIKLLEFEQPLIYLFAEVKPTIDSIGEVMRQIKIYSSYIAQPLDRFVEQKTRKIQQKNIAIVTYGSKHRDLFEEQGFIYIDMGKEPEKPKQTIEDWAGDSK